MSLNTAYKDSVFSLLFSAPDTLRELYSALQSVPVDPALPITINTLSDVLYMERCNDISFTIGNKLVVLIEHQSTINPNTPGYSREPVSGYTAVRRRGVGPANGLPGKECSSSLLHLWIFCIFMQKIPINGHAFGVCKV
jgi:hypothetical protein